MSDRFEKLCFLAEGGFSKVFKYRDNRTETDVAVKRIHAGGHARDGLPVCALSEVKALTELRHPNIIHLHHIFHAKGRLHLVMDLCKTDMEEVLRYRDGGLDAGVAKAVMAMVLTGLQHVHEMGFIHQDIKPGNLLVADDNTVKLTDFGLATMQTSPNPRLFHQVVTLAYRAPELVLGSRRHHTGIDMWAAGCVFAELHTASRVFEATSEIGLLSAIIGLIGAPTTDAWPGMADLPLRMEFADIPPKPLEEAFPTMSADARDLLGKMLVYNPDVRLTAAQALAHPYFSNNDPKPTPKASLGLEPSTKPRSPSPSLSSPGSTLSDELL